MTTTDNFNFNKPTVGGDADVWGDLLNDNWDQVDAELTEHFGAEVPIAGGDVGPHGIKSAAGRDTGTAPENVPTNADFAITSDLTGTSIPAVVGQGAIVDIIENDDGTAIRWESGLQVCFHAEEISDWESSVAHSFTFPASFVTSHPATSMAVSDVGSAARANARSVMFVSDHSRWLASVDGTGDNDGTVGSRVVNMQATGFWK